MDKLQFNILLEEIGIYEKRKLKKGEAYNKESDFIYTHENSNDVYEITPNGMSFEDLQLALIAKQIEKLNSIHSTIIAISLMIIFSFLLILFFLFL